MGRIIGRRPDPTPATRRALRRVLEPGEQVLAGLHVQRPGTRSSALQGGAAAGVGAAVGSDSVTFSGGDEGHAGWLASAARFGIDPGAARRAIKLALVVTSSRLLLVRRSYITGRLRQVLVAVPLADVERIEAPRGGSSLVVSLRSRSDGRGDQASTAGSFPGAAEERVRRDPVPSAQPLSGGELRLELPQAHRFLPDIYREVPAVLARAQAEARAGS